MKNIKFLALTAAFGFVAVAAQAHDGALSPKESERRAHGFTGVGTEVRQSFEFVRGNKNVPSAVAGTASKDNRDLVREQRGVVYTGKSPFRVGPKQIEIAPVK